MRYLGNKEKLIHFIDRVIEKYEIEGNTFADLFAGSGAVAGHYKNKYQLITNDAMYFSTVLSAARINNGPAPEFDKFRNAYGNGPFEVYNSREYVPQDNYFVYNSYSPRGGRQYFTEENSVKIDGVRIDIEDDYSKGLLSTDEYYYLLGSLLESVTRVSNTSGTYQAFFKFWESRSLKKFQLAPLLVIGEAENRTKHRVYCRDANQLAREISGDIAYIDPPYTSTQYANMYHVLETIAKYDSPEIFGKTGRRKNRTLSPYSNRNLALEEFEDLFRQLDFEHVIVSYSNQGIVKLDELIRLASKFSVNNKVYVENQSYRTYATNNLSMKDTGEGLKEVVLYFRKERRVNKSPLNYSGSKDVLVPVLTKHMPKHIEVFVDAMGGAANVAANVVATRKVVYNEINPRIAEIISILTNQKTSEVVSQVKDLINEFGLTKKDKSSFVKYRQDYNSDPTPIKLFVLQIYAFQNMIRFNGSGYYNTPVGNNEYNKGTENRILSFIPRVNDFSIISGPYQDLDIHEFPESTIFYFDPPYFITKAEYNDGKRGASGWTADSETELLDFLLNVDRSGRNFMLSNVLTHNGRVHHVLRDWVEEHGFQCSVVGRTGIKYPRTEVVVTNYRTLSYCEGEE